MKNFISLAVVAGALFACSSPCEKYVAAATDCAEAAGATTDVSADAACADDDGSGDEMFECMAEAYDGADCSTEEGLFEAALSSLECAGDLTGGDTAASE